jgi:acyl-homoserine-lactone acylase
MRYLNHFFEKNHAQSVRDIYEIQTRNQGVPWVNTIAADSTGEAYYADISVVPNVPDSHATVCNTALGIATTQLLGLPVLDGSRSSCGWLEDPDAIVPGIFGPGNLPHLFRDDYVTNSNDSYWLSNPREPLTGFARIVGDEQTPRSLRTRLGLIMVEERLAGTDEYEGTRFTQEQLRAATLNNRQYAAELVRDDLAAFCESLPSGTALGTGGPVDVSGACPILGAWDLRDDLDSPGAILFRRFWANLVGLDPGMGLVELPVPGLNVPWSVPFDAGNAQHAQHTRPARPGGAGRRGRGPGWRRNPARRRAARLAVRDQGRRADSDPRRARRLRGLQLHQRRLGPGERVRRRRPRLEFHHGRQLRRR